MIGRHARLILPFLVGTLALAGCERTAGLTGENTARLTIQLTDAPGDLKEAWVKLGKITLQGTSAGDSTAGRVEFTPVATEWIDLLKLSGGELKTLVPDAVVPAGTYRQLRLIVTDAYVVTRENRVFATPGAVLPSGLTSTGELICPGCAQSGFKVIFPGGVVVDGNTTLVIDFDVNQSFGHEAGRSGKFILRPVLIGSRKESGASLGAISGKVTLQNVTLPVNCGGASFNQSALLTRFVPTARVGETTRTGQTSGEGTFRIGALPAGSYALGTTGVGFSNGDTLRFTASANPSSVTVSNGQTSSAAFAVTAASCTPG